MEPQPPTYVKGGSCMSNNNQTELDEYKRLIQELGYASAEK